MSQLYGYLSVFGSIIFFGSGGAPLKIKKISNLKTYDNKNKKGIHPLLFHIYLLFGILCSSLFLYTYIPAKFNIYILIAAFLQTLLFLPPNILAIASIQKIGIATAISIWSGVSIIISFLWGVILFPGFNKINNIVYVIISLILLIIGLINFIISFNLENKDNSNNDIINENKCCICFNKNRKNNFLGILYAFIVGLLNGSILVPMQFFHSFTNINIEIFAFNVTIYFSIFNIIISPIYIILYFVYQKIKKSRQLPLFHIKWGFPAGFLVGIIWSIGNICSVYATLFLGISLGFPLSQLALIVNAIWGIIIFKELKNPKALLIWLSAIFCLLIGALILSNSLNEPIFYKLFSLFTFFI